MSVSEDFYRRRYEELRERWNAQVTPDEKLRKANLRAARLADERRQAIDALRDAEQWAFELGHEGLSERLRAALVKLGEQQP